MSTTFAPPTGPVVWAPPASPGADALSLGPSDPPTSPGGRRRPVALALAVVAVVGLGVAALVALTAGGADQGVTLPDAPAFDLAAAAQSTIEARTVEFDLVVTTGQLGRMSLTGAVDNETQLARVTTDLSRLLGTDGMLGGATIEVLVDGANDTVYLAADALAGLLPAGSSWISLDLARLAELTGEPLADMRGQILVDPAEAARMLLDADEVDEVGTEIIDGVDTMRYRVTVDVAAALAASPQLGGPLDPAGAELPETIVYDVWVTEANELRRAAVDLVVAGETVSMVLDMTTAEGRLDLEIPADAFDITAWLDW
jgi:hypothetical protein